MITIQKMLEELRLVRFEVGYYGQLQIAYDKEKMKICTEREHSEPFDTVNSGFVTAKVVEILNRKMREARDEISTLMDQNDHQPTHERQKTTSGGIAMRFEIEGQEKEPEKVVKLGLLTNSNFIPVALIVGIVGFVIGIGLGSSASESYLIQPLIEQGCAHYELVAPDSTETKLVVEGRCELP